MKSLHAIKHRKNPSTTPIVATIACLVIAGVGIWYFFFNKPAAPSPADAINTANGINYAPPTEEEKQATNDKKDEIIKQEEPTPTDATLSVTVSRSFQEAGTLQLRTVVTGTTEGNCIATFTKAGQPTVTKTFPVAFEATSALCKDAFVPVSEFGASGTWSLNLIVKKDNKQSAAATASIDIAK